MKTHYIHRLEELRPSANIGNKARSLKFLQHHHFPTPKTFVCTWDAYAQATRNGSEIKDTLHAELSKKIDPHTSYAVRSSSNFEDGHHYSAPGLFITHLDVHGIEGVEDAIESIWSSTLSPRVRAYMEKIGMDPSLLTMAVIIQEMVAPIISGVSFSKNPLTGRNEVVVEAVRGSGEALVQEGVTPKRWIKRADAWIEKASPEDIPTAIIENVIAETKKVEKTYGKPVDLEWVYDGQTLTWVQLRDIGTLQSTDWYSNRFSKEFMPGIIAPLVYSTNMLVVCGAWKRFFTELIGDNDVAIDRLGKLFYYRAYFNMGVVGSVFEALGFPPDSLEILMGFQKEGPKKLSYRVTRKAITLLPRLLVVAVGKMRADKKLDTFLSSMEKEFKSFPLEGLDQMSERELMESTERLFTLTKETAHYLISAVLTMYIYNRIATTQLARAGVQSEQFDLTHDMPELTDFDPTAHLKDLSDAYAHLDGNLQDAIREKRYEEFLELEGIDPFTEQVTRFLTQFGHVSNCGNDFSSVPWRETPDLILRMITDYEKPQTNGGKRITLNDLKPSFLRRLLLTLTCRRARKFRFYREAVNFLYTYGYGLFRTYFLALGSSLTRKGHMKDPQDIFCLYLEEVREIIKESPVTPRYTETIAKRKEEMKAYEDVTLPDIIYGNEPPPLEVPKKSTLKGIPTAPGYYRGRVKVVRGIEDFHKMERGDVLVIPHSDVGLTPLFAKAGAVITEAGGMLSHSAIIAREYGIPAVLSVTGACALKDNTLVTINGHEGEVLVHS
jgi:pyruvate,water dikinase